VGAGGIWLALEAKESSSCSFSAFLISGMASTPTMDGSSEKDSAQKIKKNQMGADMVVPAIVDSGTRSFLEKLSDFFPIIPQLTLMLHDNFVLFLCPSWTCISTKRRGYFLAQMVKFETYVSVMLDSNSRPSLKKC
jgi:hypothetical protein